MRLLSVSHGQLPVTLRRSGAPIAACIVACLLGAAPTWASNQDEFKPHRLRPFLNHFRVVHRPIDPAAVASEVSRAWVSAHDLFLNGNVAKSALRSKVSGWSANEALSGTAYTDLAVEAVLENILARIGAMYKGPHPLYESIFAVVNVPDQGLADKAAEAANSARYGGATTGHGGGATVDEAVAGLAAGGRTFDDDLRYVVFGPTIGGRMVAEAGWSLNFFRIVPMDPMSGPTLDPDNNWKPVDLQGIRVWMTNRAESPEAQAGVAAFGFDLYTDGAGLVQPWFSEHHPILPGTPTDQITPSDKLN